MSISKLNRRWINCIASAVLGLSCIVIPAVSEAKAVTVEGDGYYILGDDDNVSTAKERARRDALRSAAEKAGVFVKSYTETNNMVLTKDEIIVVSSNLLNVQRESITNESVNGLGFKINCHVVAMFDTDNINMMSTLNTQTIAIKERDDAIERLNQENARLKAQVSAQNTAKLRENETAFKIKLYERELLKEVNNSKDDEAKKWADKIKELDADNDVYRCFAYYYLSKQQCVEICDKYLATHPNDFIAEICRINALDIDVLYHNEKEKKAMNNLVDRAKKILPMDAYYSLISPTVIKRANIVEGPSGSTLNGQIAFLFELANGLKVSSQVVVRGEKKLSDMVIVYANHPDDIDGKECDKVISRYQNIYFAHNK